MKPGWDGGFVEVVNEGGLTVWGDKGEEKEKRRRGRREEGICRREVRRGDDL
jgi:hypothetical protein